MRERDGTRFESDNAALAYGLRIIKDLKKVGRYDDLGLTMVVKNAKGKTVFSIPDAWLCPATGSITYC